jgi:hypothetical protein
MKRIVYVTTMAALLVTSGELRAQSACQQAAQQSLTCFEGFCALHRYSTLCTDQMRSQLTAGLAVSECGGAAEAQANVIVGQTCDQMTAAWPAGASSCEMLANHWTECYGTFCGAHPTSPECDPASMSARTTAPATCDLAAVIAAETSVATACDTLTAGWPTEPPPTPCELAHAHVVTCAQAFCAAHATSPQCTAEHQAEWTTVPTDCSDTAAGESAAVLAGSCDQITASWPTEPPPTPCELAHAHVVTCAQAFCAAHATSPQCTAEHQAEWTTVPTDCSDTAAGESAAVLAGSCDQITASWPTEPPPPPPPPPVEPPPPPPVEPPPVEPPPVEPPPVEPPAADGNACQAAFDHMRGCVEAYCGSHAGEPICAPGLMDDAGQNVPATCTGDDLVMAQQVLAQSCDDLMLQLAPPTP